MKKTIQMAALALMVSFAAVSCKKTPTDADLTTKATTAVVAYPGVKVTVKEGKAHLEGAFADDASKQAAIDALKKVEGVKDVHDMATVTPPVATAVAVDPAVTKKVTDALKDFPGVKAEVVNGTLTLTGNASPEQARKIKMSIDALKIGKYENKLTVK